MNPVVEAVRSKHPGAYDDLSDDELTLALGQKYGNAYLDVPEFAQDLKRLSSGPRPGETLGGVMRETEEGQRVLEGGRPDLIPEPGPDWLKSGPPLPSPAEGAVPQEPLRFEPKGALTPEAPADLPDFGKEGTMTRGFSDVGTGLAEWAMNRPEEFAGTLLSAPVSVAVAARYAPEILNHFQQDVRAGAKGDAQAAGRALGMFMLVAAPLAAKFGKRAIGKAVRTDQVRSAEESFRDWVARDRLALLEAQGAPTLPRAERPLLPATAEMTGRPMSQESISVTPQESVTFAQGPDRGERRALLRSRRPEVPEGPSPEPQRGLTVVEEIRQAGADTKEKVRALFPHLSREEAKALRDQAYPPQPEEPRVSRAQAEQIFPEVDFGKPEGAPPTTPPVGGGGGTAEPLLRYGGFQELPDIPAAAQVPGVVKGPSGKYGFDLWTTTRESALGPANTTLAGPSIESNLGKLSEAEAAQVKTTLKDPNARQITKTAEVYGDVRQAPVEGQRQVPAEEGGGGVRPPTQAPRPSEPPAQPQPQAPSEPRVRDVGEMTPDEAVKAGVDRGDYYRGVADAFREGKISEPDFVARSKAALDVDAWPRFKVGDEVWVSGQYRGPGQVTGVNHGSMEVTLPDGKISRQSNNVLEPLASYYERHPENRPPGKISPENKKKLDELRRKTPTPEPPPTTPAPEMKIQAEVTDVAKKDGVRDAKEVKAELLDKIQRAIDVAPREADVRASSYTEMGGKTVSTPDKAEKITISIPGDGDFTIRNTKEALSEILKRAQKINTSAAPKTPHIPQKAIESSEKVLRDQAETRARAEREKEQARPDPEENPQGSAAAPAPAQPAMPGSPTPVPPVITQALQIPLKPTRQIIAELAHGIGVPIRFGRLITGKKYGGYYLPRKILIRSRKANDLITVTHEVGHRLDEAHKLRTQPALDAELMHLGDNARPGSHSSWTPKKTLDYRRGEGVAEFVRYWLMDPAEAKRLAPKMHAVFEAILEANRDVGGTMRQAQRDIDLHRAAPLVEKFTSRISTGTDPIGAHYSLPDRIQRWYQEVIQRNSIDNLRYARLASRDLERFQGRALKPSEDIYMLGRLLRGNYGRAEAFLTRGVVDFKTLEAKIGTSLVDILKPVAGTLDTFGAYITARQISEMQKKGKAKDIDPAEVQATLNLYKSKVNDDVFERVKEFNDSVLDYLVDSGHITPEQRSAMKEAWDDYVPLHRVFEAGAGETSSQTGGGAGQGLKVSTPPSLKRRGDSTRDIVNPIETLFKNVYTAITAAEKSWLHQQLSELANKPGMGKWVERIPEPKEAVKFTAAKIREELKAAGVDMSMVPDDLLLTIYRGARVAPFGENIIKVKDAAGKPVFLQLNKDLFDTFNALDLENSLSVFKVMRGMANWLRGGVTLDPAFQIRNLFRDTFGGAVVSNHWMVPFESTVRGLSILISDALGKEWGSKIIAEWAAAGGKNSVESAFFDRKDMQRFIKDKLGGMPISERMWFQISHPFQVLRWLGERTENISRLGEYQRGFNEAKKKGLSDRDARLMAAFESRDRQDFAKGGAKTKVLREIVPFWNAMLQGNVRFGQRLLGHPIKTFVKGFAYITLPTLAEQALNWDDEDYWALPRWRRWGFYNIKIGEDPLGHSKFVPLPRPFLPGVVFGQSVVSLLEWMKDSGHNDRAYEFLKKFIPFHMGSEVLATPVPPIARTAAELVAGRLGWDYFRGRSVVDARLQDLPPEEQFTSQSSLTARELGKLIGVSPMKIDHAISSTFAGTGRMITHQTVDRIIEQATGEERTAQGKAPFASLVTTPAGTQSQHVEDFYNARIKVTEQAALQKMGKPAKPYYVLSDNFEAAAIKMGELRKMARLTQDPLVQQTFNLQIQDLAKDMNRLAEGFGLK